MRVSVVLLVCSVAGILGGGALIGVWALGVCLIFCSLCAGGWALFHDDGTAPAVPQEEPAQPGAWGIPGRRVPVTPRQVFAPAPAARAMHCARAAAPRCGSPLPGVSSPRSAPRAP